MNIQKGRLISGNFMDNSMIFQIKGDMKLKAGNYAIIPAEDFNKIISLCKGIRKSSIELNKNKK